MRVSKHNTSFKVDKDNELMKFLMEKMPQNSRNNIKSLLTQRRVMVDDVIVSQYNAPLKEGQKVSITKTKITKHKLEGVSIVYEDNDILVVEKERGILSVATQNEREKTAYNILKNYLKEKNSKDKIFVVHRLDRDTSGVMIFAKSEKAQDILQTTWNDSVKERTYVALVEGNVKKNSDTIISYLAENKAMITYSTDNEEEGKKAVSHYKVLKRNKNYSLLEVNIETGRKNQIRVHMQDLGHSVVGDKKYGSTKNPIKRLGLHAHTIVFKHPITKEVLSFTSKIPEAFLSLFK
ncbi:RluA family pseudouridine synthase [uncultured Fusobacterium sp.]|uniref:RluA family pseudouridine synthase n=1 Tax=uncultured Fusobacterium sp. TaxID=159267 RepID=UPI0025D33317|nr:RluA family pseudouridine synthase [uncultured Fusobacterium sp.]